SRARGCYGAGVAANGLFVQPALDGSVLAFDERTGAVRWTAASAAGGLGDTRWAAVSASNVVVTSMTGILVGLDAATGAERWRNSSFLYPPVFRPVADGCCVYLNYGTMLRAYDVATGALVWSRPLSTLQEGPWRGMVAPGSDRLFVAGSDGSYALRR